MTTYKTSVVDKHSHTWNPDNKFTSVNNKHKHKISADKRIALKGDTDHIHLLLRK